MRVVLFGALLLLIGIGAVTAILKRGEFAEEARQSALEQCAQDPDFDCALIDKHHKECFEVSYSSGGRHSGHGFNINTYNACLKMGKAAYKKLMRQRAKEARDEVL